MVLMMIIRRINNFFSKFCSQRCLVTLSTLITNLKTAGRNLGPLKSYSRFLFLDDNKNSKWQWKFKISKFCSRRGLVTCLTPITNLKTAGRNSRPLKSYSRKQRLRTALPTDGRTDRIGRQVPGFTRHYRGRSTAAAMELQCSCNGAAMQLHCKMLLMVII